MCTVFFQSVDVCSVRTSVPKWWWLVSVCSHFDSPNFCGRMRMLSLIQRTHPNKRQSERSSEGKTSSNHKHHTTRIMCSVQPSRPFSNNLLVVCWNLKCFLFLFIWLRHLKMKESPHRDNSAWLDRGLQSHTPAPSEDTHLSCSN